MMYSCFVILVAVSSVVVAAQECKTVPTLQDFDLDRYIEKSWFIQRQQITSYLDPETFFCVSATYQDEGRRRFGRKAITVLNYSNDGGVNVGSSGAFPLCATRPRPNMEPSKLEVAPCFVPNLLAGPYWVVAVGPEYSWAIVVGGQPTIQGECDDTSLCTTSENSGFINLNGNNEGLWFFTRDRVASTEMLDTMEETALSLGLCTSNMFDVVQEGCLYEGHVIKE